MIAVVATIKIRPDMAEQFERITKKLEAEVRANEEGCLLYRMTRSRTDPLLYKNLEIFRDQKALDHHTSAAYFLAALEPMRDCVAEASQVEFLDTLLD